MRWQTRWRVGMGVGLILSGNLQASGYRGPFDVAQIREIIGAGPGGPSRGVIPIPLRPELPVPMTLDYYAVRYVHPMDLKQILTELFPDSRFSVDVRNRQVVYWAALSDRPNIRIVMGTVDIAPCQIQVDVQVIESSGEFSDTLQKWLLDAAHGVKWTVNFSQLALVPNVQMDGFLSALRSSGQATMISRPTITTNDNQKAMVRVGDRVPYLTTVISDRTTSVQVNQVDTGIELEVLPQILPDDVIHLEIKAVVDNIKRYRDLAGGQYPIVTHRLAQTIVDIPDGHTLVIAGLLDDQQKFTRTTVPGLSDIPVVGGWFSGQSEERVTNDVVILISPKIVRAPKKKEALR